MRIYQVSLAAQTARDQSRTATTPFAQESTTPAGPLSLPPGQAPSDLTPSSQGSRRPVLGALALVFFLSFQQLTPTIDARRPRPQNGFVLVQSATTMKPLFIPLKTQWFREFAAGRKTIEYRAYGPRWHEGTCYAGRPAVLSHGYSGDRINARVKRFRRIPIGNAPRAVQQLYAGRQYLAEIVLSFNE